MASLPRGYTVTNQRVEDGHLVFDVSLSKWRKRYEIVKAISGLGGFTGMSRRWFCRLEWKPQDCWVGVFWKRDHPWQLDVWVCLLPLAPLHFGWKAQVAHAPQSGEPAERVGHYTNPVMTEQADESREAS